MIIKENAQGEINQRILWSKYRLETREKVRSQDILTCFCVVFFFLLLLFIFVLFSAVNPPFLIICEGNKGIISCQNGKRIDVLNATYGRLDRQTCSDTRIKSTNCRSNNSLKHVQGKCDGTTECQLQANNSVFGDPCEGTYKYLEVKYRCQESIGNYKRETIKCARIMRHTRISKVAKTALTVSNVSWPWVANTVTTHVAGNVA